MKRIILSVVIAIVTSITMSAQKKVILLDISHEQKAEYLKVSPDIIEGYQEIITRIPNATLKINEEGDLDKSLLKNTDVLIMLSPLTPKTTRKPITAVEKEAIIDFVKRGGRLAFFFDESKRVDLETYGANDIVKPFGMEYGSDLDLPGNIGAISFIGEITNEQREMPYSGSRSLSGGIPLSVANYEGAHLHGAYVKLENGGKIIAFAETMVALFLGSPEGERLSRNGMDTKWWGKDSSVFMQEIISWLLK